MLKILGLVFILALSCLTSAIAVEPSSATEPLGDGQDARGYGGLARRIVIFISGKPWLINEGTIDGMVGEREKLEPATDKKINALHPRLRMEQYTFFTENIHQLRFDALSTNSESPRGDLIPLSLSEEKGTAHFNSTKNTLIRHFSTSELIDLSVYKMSQRRFFATSSDAAWKRTKKTVIRYDLPLGVIIGSLMAAKDDLSLRASGWVIQLFDDRIRVGWYANAQDVGVHWRPTFDAGGVVATKDMTFKVGAVEHPGATGAEIGRSLQAKFSHYFQGAAGNGGHWDFTSNAAVKWVAESPDPKLRRDVVGNLEAYARRPILFFDTGSAHSQEPDYALMIKTALESNFVDRYSVYTGVTLENDKRQLQISLRGRISQSEASRADYFVGIFVGGDFVSELERLRSENAGHAAKTKVQPHTADTPAPSLP